MNCNQTIEKTEIISEEKHKNTKTDSAMAWKIKLWTGVQKNKTRRDQLMNKNKKLDDNDFQPD